MEKTEMMKRFEEETGIEWDGTRTPQGYLEWMKAYCIDAFNKAKAYDRLMSGGKKSLKEWANILGKPVAIDAENRLWWFPKKPEIGLVTWIWYDNQFGSFGEELPKNLIDYTGNWKDSLTLPDEWEEK